MQKELWKAGNMLYPLPAVMVSCSENGKNNIITVAWTGTVCTNPPMLSISVRPERFSHGMIERTGEFVVNLTTKGLVRACDFCGVRSGRDIDKFKEAGLTACRADFVEAPLIAESPVNIECRVKQILRLGSHDMFLAEVLGVHVSGRYINEKRKLELAKAEPVVYSHGEYYGLGELLGSFGYSVKKQAGGRTDYEKKCCADRDAGSGKKHRRRRAGQADRFSVS
ncbi:MAG: flavin reductase family protein [Lachnospiraceae bacterium]|nr:flavin reductase family protein [Lachnospiraceae bacterium]